MKHPSAGRRRRGFTLVETVVTVGLIAVLAAFVIPTVIQKASAGDPVKVANDLNSIRTGLESFATDTKTGFPNRVFMLTVKPTTADHLVDSASAGNQGTTLTQAQVNIWNGPYVATTIGAGVADSLPTGFTGFVKNHLQRYDVVSNKGEHSGGTVGATFVATNTLFVAIRVVGLTLSQAQAVNRLIDGSNDPDVAAGDPTNPRANITGRFRYDTSNGSSPVVAYYLSVPVTQ
jgi:prepilin-type N-terminal cleavage/methylation domain-containing protein